MEFGALAFQGGVCHKGGTVTPEYTFMGQQFLLRTRYLPSPRNLSPNQAHVHIQGCQAQDFTLDTPKSRFPGSILSSQCPNTEATCRCMISYGYRGWGWEKAISISDQWFRIGIGAFQKGQHAWSFEEGVSAASPTCPCCCRSTSREARSPTPVPEGQL